MAERRHGTSSSYFNGCTDGAAGGPCVSCKEAGIRHRQVGTMQRYLSGLTDVQPLFYPYDRTTPFNLSDPRHGSISAYTQGCRCAWCRAAGKAYREYKKLGLKLPRGYNSRSAGSNSPRGTE